MLKSMNRRALLQGASAGAVAITLAGAPAFRSSAAAAVGKPVIGDWGFDIAAMDKTISPGDDFFRHVGGTWMKNTKIPEDRSRWGSFNMLAAKSEDDVRDVVETAAKSKPAKGSVARKVVDYFESYNDVAGINAKGLEPAKADLARIAGLQTHEDIVRLWASKDFRASCRWAWVSASMRSGRTSISSASANRASACRTATIT
jgi:putative endopeptidase